jgi:hypothetical protein
MASLPSVRRVWRCGNCLLFFTRYTGTKVKNPYKTLTHLIFECGRPNFCLMASLPSVRRE